MRNRISIGITGFCCSYLLHFRNLVRDNLSKAYFTSPVEIKGGVWYNANTHSFPGVVKSYALLLAGWCMGLFLYADGEAAAADLFGVSLVQFWQHFFEGGRIKALAQNIGVADDVTACAEFFGASDQ